MDRSGKVVSDFLVASGQAPYPTRAGKFSQLADPSITTIVFGERLPWPDDASSFADKGPFDPAAIYHSGVRLECEIRKISCLGVTVRTQLATALGERVAVELATGQRAPGKIAWAKRGELGVRFEDSIDVIALLNRKLVSQLPERRSMPRLEVRCLAHVKFAQQFMPVMLRNISTRGVQLEGSDLPPVGTYVSLFVEGLNMPAGEIVWRHNDLAGVEVFEELSWTSIIPWVRKVVRKDTN